MSDSFVTPWDFPGKNTGSGISFSRGSSRPRDQTWVSALQADSLPTEPPVKPKYIFIVHILVQFLNPSLKEMGYLIYCSYFLEVFGESVICSC